jgi:hypothetical protein
MNTLPFTNINNSKSLANIQYLDIKQNPPKQSYCNLINYLDDNINGRRVDINFNPYILLHNDNSINGVTRLILQSLLWSAKKIN